MKIALAQINPTVGKIDANVEKIVSFARRAADAGAELVVFPEMAVCGYPPKDLLLKESFVEANLHGLRKIASQCKEVPLVVGFVERNHGLGRPLHNAAALLENGEITAVRYKTLLPTYDVFDEDRYFEPAVSYESVSAAGSQFGVSICEDIWTGEEIQPRRRYQVDPIARLLETKVDFLLNISASPYTVGKENVRLELVRNLAIKHGVVTLYVNQVGGNDELIFDGRSFAIGADGNVLAQGKAFEEDLVLVDLASKGKPFVKPADDHIADVYEALKLGTRDYMHKCGFKKAVVGLSGGIDSAVVCAIASAAIGRENMLGVLMPSPYSSQGSLEDAEALAKNLGIEYRVIPISPGMQTFDTMLAPLFEGRPHDLTEENIQARLRGVILMSISNKFGNLVLTTGNKSELAVGYCTMYGDMCGGLAVISDVRKTMVYDLAHCINRVEGKEIIPANSIEKPPSAELRPGQTDQDTLPPYAVLDAILEAYVEHGESAEKIVKRGFDPAVVMDVINRIDRNEYKRYQAAPGLKITTRSFGFEWRMPIAQGFKEQIKRNELLC